MQKGDWLYTGVADIGVDCTSGDSLQMSMVPRLADHLHHQQEDLSLLCEAHSLPRTSLFSAPLSTMHNRIDSLADELGGGPGTRVYNEVERACGMFPWVDADQNATAGAGLHSLSRVFFEVNISGWAGAGSAVQCL
jgi:hypothetical protein